MAKLQSWVGSANAQESDFPLMNLPYGVFSDGRGARCCVAIGDRLLDLGALETRGMLPGTGFAEPGLNAFMAAGPAAWARVRNILTGLLSDGSRSVAQLSDLLHPIAGARMELPFRVAGFTDFYAGRHHAEAVGAMFRGPENALPPNWLSVPIGYNGRASSVVISGTPVRRPWGQVKGPEDALPRFAPSARFDMELEFGTVIGTGSEGMIPVAEAEEMIFGHVLLNDWSARDIQAWEYQPLGPFQSKATATSISPWVVPRAALSAFRVATPPRSRPLLPYLRERGPLGHDIALEAALIPGGGTETVICRTSTRELYYSAAQQIAHHASSGCPMQTGDLIGSGTISGPGPGSRGSLLEASKGGAAPLRLQGGETRAFLEDGDTVVLRGAALGPDYRIGFGECRGQVLPAAALPGWAREDTNEREA